jgi:hypothetical protein
MIKSPFLVPVPMHPIDPIQVFVLVAEGWAE